VHGERWRVRCEGAVARGDRIRVIERKGLVLRVQPA
jgi:membrane-bound serine protease (ClpP class)